MSGAKRYHRRWYHASRIAKNKNEIKSDIGHMVKIRVLEYVEAVVGPVILWCLLREQRDQ